jgi:hypothetical protein
MVLWLQCQHQYDSQRSHLRNVLGLKPACSHLWSLGLKHLQQQLLSQAHNMAILAQQ